MSFKGDFPQPFIAISKTATSDAAFTLTSAAMWFREINIHISTNAAKYGDLHTQDAQISAGDVISFQDVDLNAIWFKNAGAAANTVIYAAGVLMTPKRKKELGVD